MQNLRTPKKYLITATLSLGTLPTAAAWAQSEAQPAVEVTLGQVAVSGKRASLTSAQKIKRDKLEIVDAVVAEEINKLPDINVTDALSRVTGIQVDRDRGEGLYVAIRGLTQVQTTLNGREVFTAGIFGGTTAGLGRVLNFADIPAEMLAGIDVYKTSSANLLEGGVAGSVDLRTRRPFDFKERQITTSIRAIHGDLVGKTEPQISLLFSDRWQTPEAGEFGLLVNVVHQKRAWREDQTGIGNVASIVVNGRNVLAPVSYTRSILMGERERIGLSSMMQWRPNDRLDLYAELNHAQLKTRENGYQTFISKASGSSESNVSLSSDGSFAESLSWSSPTLQTAGRARDTVDRTTQAALGGNLKDDALTLKADLSHTWSYNDLAYTAINNNGSASSVTMNWSTAAPVVTNPNFTSPGPGATYSSRPFDDQLTTLQLDGEYRLAGDWLDAIASGMRYARHAATDAPGQINKTCPAASPPCGAWTAAGAWLTNSPYSDYPIGNPDAARSNRAEVAGALQAPSGNLPGTWTIAERTLSTHVMAKIKSRVLSLDGNLGVRIVHTLEEVEGYAGQASGNTFSAVNNQSRYTDTLPSVNLRYEWEDGLYLRAAASKTMTRPDFNQLSPSLTLNSVLAIGSAGNPFLKPVRADNLDFAIERYVSSTTSVHATAFFKKVDGFVLTSTKTETYGGVDYQVSRPYNAKSADIKGIELGYQQFYDFLPGWMRGLGLQANYTHVDSATLDTTLGTKVPLQNLSKHSYNLIGLYELGDLSARVAYNWRSHFLNSVINVTNIGGVPIYTKAYGWLDASLSFRLDKKTTLSIEGLNLLRTVRRSYFGTEDRPQTRWQNDRQIGVSLAFSY